MAMDHNDNAERLPLAGVRVLDVTQVWAGPYSTRWLADMGAEVIKVESIQHPDSERLSAARRGPAAAGGEPYFNRGPRFNQVNCNKLGITLDFSRPEGVGIYKRLVKVSDVVVENYSAGIMKRFGIDYESLRLIRPDLIMMSMPGFGSKGPQAHHLSYGPVQEAVCGLISITGYHPGEYLETGEFYADPINGSFGAAALFAALFNKRRTGRGVYIDLAQSEAMIACLPELVLEYQMTGRTLQSVANRHPFKAPHGCYRCSGEDQWLVISVGNEDEWRGLCEAMQQPHLLADPRLATMRDRLAHQDELDAVIEAWTADKEHYQLMHLLQREGVPAQAVVNIEEMIHDPHIQARGLLETVPSPWTGDQLTVGVPCKIPGVPAAIRRHAPGLGEHNRQVLQELAGVSDQELDALEASGVIGYAPAVR
jgi:crotonobetainyl-CoA:carnitine CoA-transferase CaiB-like acyl-CoA transferase